MTRATHYAGWLIYAVATLAIASDLQAAEVTRSGSSVTVRGRIEAGDDAKFDRAAPQGSYRAVMLSSPGAGEGGLPAAVAMAESIKASGAITVVDASRNTCASACTLLFVAGSQRYYAGGSRISDGLRNKGLPGLGFHQSRSARGTATMAGVYSAMGAPAGAELSGRSPFETLYYISGATAISTGIATSLDRP